MTMHELVDAARRAIANSNCEGSAKMALVVVGKWPDGGRKRLAGRRGPLGQCISEDEDHCICVFDAQEVLSWALKQPHVRPLETV
jgi:hypothetical protein